MIGKLFGKIDFVGEQYVLLDVNGVGYEVHCGTRTLANCTPNENISLIIETHVREKEIKLFGFENQLEKDWFTLLQNVQGIGAKVALTILNTFSPSEISQAIALQDKTMFGRVPGIGAKVAARIISELKDKLPATIAVVDGDDKIVPSLHQDALSALLNLGYSNMQATQAISKILQTTEIKNSGELIRLALQELSKS